MLKIGVDLHGCLNADESGILKFIMKFHTLNKLQEFWIVSGGKTYESIEKELKEIKVLKGIHYKGIIPVVDFLWKQGADITYDKDGNPWCADEVWWASKAAICQFYDIFLMIDDLPRYGDYFQKDQNFILYKDFISNITKNNLDLLKR